MVFCGVGNNGGDGFIIAGLAEKAGLEARVVQVGDSDKIQGDALTARQFAQEAGAVFDAFDAARFYPGDVVVDAVLGTGLTGSVRDDVRPVIDSINRCQAPVLAVDIPSGLCSDTGRVLGEAVCADVTVTFIGVKQGLLTGQQRIRVS